MTKKKLRKGTRVSVESTGEDWWRYSGTMGTVQSVKRGGLVSVVLDGRYECGKVEVTLRASDLVWLGK